MANAKRAAGNEKRQGRRVMPKARKVVRATAAATQKATLTVGDLIAAAFDAVGGEVRDVARVLSSRQVSRATGRKLVFV